MNDPRHPLQPPRPQNSQSHVPQPPHATHPPPHAPHSPHPPPPRVPSPHPPPPRPVATPPVQPATPPARPGIAPVPTLKPPQDDLEPIALIEEEEPAAAPTPVPGQTQQQPAKSKIKAFGVETMHVQHEWKRQPTKTGTGACRVRSFHGKYSEQGLEYIDNAINEWLDNHPEIEVKFVTSTVMTFEGKIREPALVLNLWY